MNILSSAKSGLCWASCSARESGKATSFMPSAESEAHWLELLLLPWLVLWMLALVWSALQRSFQPGPALWEPLWLAVFSVQVLGVLVILAGDAIFVWALISFGNSWRIGIDERSTGALVTNGIFAFSRNPIFAFIDLYCLGTFLMNGSLVFLAFAVVTILVLHYQIRQEEKFLAGRYGRAYQDYCRQAGRYFNPKAVLQRSSA
jgi:protein-S-isoprenylcysteine O-methyltransferase Ste14